ncbi:exocyst complex component 3-like [Artemia franciscana]
MEVSPGHLGAFKPNKLTETNHNNCLVVPKPILEGFQRSDQIPKVEQMLKKVTYKKASLDAQLKNAMEGQMDGIRTGMENLDTALKHVKEVELGLHGIKDALKNVDALNEKLSEVRKEHVKHSQLAAAMENLKHIFTVPESVEKTREWISDGKLLYAHQSLMDLENSRDSLLFELHKHAGAPQGDQRLLISYFADVSALSKELLKQIKLTLVRTLNVVRKEPKLVVTALRLVEREEAIDRMTLSCQNETGFLPPDRPKMWKDEAMSVLRSAVQNRVEGNRPAERETTKTWLTLYLESIRSLILEDLKVVNQLCVPVFPPHWNVCQMFLDFYHDALRDNIEELVRNGLVDDEYLFLLNWACNTYPSAECMNHHSVRSQMENLEIRPLLEKEQIESLINMYIKELTEKIKGLFLKTLNTVSNDWEKNEPPEIVKNYTRTELAPLIFKNIEDHLKNAKIVSQDMLKEVLLLNLKLLLEFADTFKALVYSYKMKHFMDRNQIPRFTEFMVALVNTCSEFIELTSQLKLRFWRMNNDTVDEVAKLFTSVADAYQKVTSEFCDYLLEEPFQDTKIYFDGIMTREWLASSETVQTICVTFKDYFSDYGMLRPDNLKFVAEEAQLGVAKRYITALLQQKLSLRTAEERKQVGEKICEEKKQLLMLFRHISEDTDESKLSPIDELADVISADNVDFLSFSLRTLAQKYRDLAEDHLICLMSIRGDLGKLEVRQKAKEVLEDAGQVEKMNVDGSIFSYIHVTASIFS